jgi:hypothetical protein
MLHMLTCCGGWHPGDPLFDYQSQRVSSAWAVVTQAAGIGLTGSLSMYVRLCLSPALLAAGIGDLWYAVFWSIKWVMLVHVECLPASRLLG